MLIRLIRWTSIANVNVNVKVDSIKLSMQVSVVPDALYRRVQISFIGQTSDVIILLFSSFGFAYNVDTTCESEATRAKHSLVCQLVCFTNGEGMNLFL